MTIINKKAHLLQRKSTVYILQNLQQTKQAPQKYIEKYVFNKLYKKPINDEIFSCRRSQSKIKENKVVSNLDIWY